MNKALIDSYLRNLLGVVLALVTTTMASSGVASPLDFGLGEWLGIANGLWAAAVPTLLRYANKQDPAFGLVANIVVAEVTRKIATETQKAQAAAKPEAPAAKKSPTKSAESKIAQVKADAERMAIARAQADVAKKPAAKKAPPKK